MRKAPRLSIWLRQRHQFWTADVAACFSFCHFPQFNKEVQMVLLTLVSWILAWTCWLCWSFSGTFLWPKGPWQTQCLMRPPCTDLASGDHGALNSWKAVWSTLSTFQGGTVKLSFLLWFWFLMCSVCGSPRLGKGHLGLSSALGAARANLSGRQEDPAWVSFPAEPREKPRQPIFGVNKKG